MLYFIMLFQNPQPPDQPKPEAEPDPPLKDDDDMFDYRLAEFDKLGFDYLHALALAWNKVSPSDVRERFLKKGATHEFVLAEFLEEE